MEWISVKDRLPELDIDGRSDDCIVAIISTSMYTYGEHVSTIGWYDHGKWHTVMQDQGNTFKKLTHWMEMPQPPKIK